MGVEQLVDGDDPTQPPDADAGRSGEVPSSRDAVRTEDHVPDSSPPEPPAEPRTRGEYADQVATPSSRPIDGYPPEPEKQSPPRDEFRAVVPPGRGDTENSRFAETPDKQHGIEEQANSNHPASNEEQRGPSDLGVEAAQPDNEGTDPSDKHEARHHDVETNSGPDMARQRDDDLGLEPDDPSEPPTVVELEGLPSDTSPIPETGRGEDLEPDLRPSREPEKESTADGIPSKQGTDHASSEITEGIHPLTDREWAEHLIEVRNELEKAHFDGLATDYRYTIDPDRMRWTRERRIVHHEIVDDVYARAQDVPCDHSAIMAGGLGGAGKTTILKEQAGVDLTKYLIINPDDIKEELARRGLVPEVEGLSPMESSDLAHEESSAIAKILARRAYADGRNLIWDITMSSLESTDRRISDLREAGYNKIDGIFVDIPIDTSITRTEARHRLGHDRFRAGHGLGGRFVPSEVIRAQADQDWGSINRRTFESLKDNFDNWYHYDNSVDDQRATLKQSKVRDQTSG